MLSVEKNSSDVKTLHCSLPRISNELLSQYKFSKMSLICLESQLSKKRPTGSKLFNSPCSNDDFSTNEDLTLPYREEVYIYACSHSGCSKTFGKKSRLLNHEKLHSGERPFKCLYKNCNKTYTRRFHLTRHIGVSHLSSTTSSAKKFNKCYICKKVYSNRYSLKKHIKVVHNHERISCPECHLVFRKQHSLKSHSYVHTKIKPFLCEHPGCGSRFRTLVNLKRHCSTHEKYHKNHFICPYTECSFKVNTRVNLVKHLSSFHPENMHLVKEDDDELMHGDISLQLKEHEEVCEA